MRQRWAEEASGARSHQSVSRKLDTRIWSPDSLLVRMWLGSMVIPKEGSKHQDVMLGSLFSYFYMGKYNMGFVITHLQTLSLSYLQANSLENALKISL